MRMEQEVKTGLGHGGITCVLQTQFSSYAYSCPLCNLNTLWNIIMILHTYVEQVMKICRVQE